MTIGCGPKPRPIEDNPVNYSELRYDLPKLTVEDPTTHVRSAHFGGKRQWLGTSPAASWQWHHFTFDDSSDILRVVITDHYGLGPGDSYAYTLQQIDPVSNAARQTWYLETRSPIGSTSRLHIFEFEIRVDAPAPLNWSASRPVAGYYQLSESVRDLSVDMEFMVGNPISAFDIGPIPE